MRTEILRSFRQEYEKLARGGAGRLAIRAAKPAAAAGALGGAALAKDFLAGIDPFGIWTANYGQAAEEAGISEEAHRLKRTVGTAGGIVGGAVVVPSVILGTIEAGKSGVLEGAKTVPKAFARGAAEPIRGVYHGTKALSALSRLEAGKELTKGDVKALQFLKSRVPLGALEDAAHGLAGKAVPTDPAKITKMLAQAARKPAKSALGSAIAQLSLGGVIGGYGAYSQYRRGREAEQGFQKRLRHEGK